MSDGYDDATAPADDEDEDGTLEGVEPTEEDASMPVEEQEIESFGDALDAAAATDSDEHIGDHGSIEWTSPSETIPSEDPYTSAEWSAASAEEGAAEDGDSSEEGEVDEPDGADLSANPFAAPNQEDSESESEGESQDEESEDESEEEEEEDSTEDDPTELEDEKEVSDDSSGGDEGAASSDRPKESSEDGFEVRLMGGLSVLKDNRDPMYIMQSVTNAASTFVLLWTMIALIIAWNSDLLEWYWALLAFAITGAVVLVVALDLFLSHDKTLERKIARFARSIQYLLAIWLWSLLIWSRSSGGPDLKGAGMLLEMVVVWVTLFAVVEVVNRVKLGRLKFAKGYSALDTLKKGIGSLSAVLTKSEISEMQSSSKEVMGGLRWVLDFATLLFFVAITAMTLGGQITLADALSSLPDQWSSDLYVVKPAMWLGSLYLLLFISESWMRVRDHGE